MSHKKSSKTIEFGDFQTPVWFAKHICELIDAIGCNPSILIEPTCGVGAFLVAGLQKFSDIETGIGVEINAEYAFKARQELNAQGFGNLATILTNDFFELDWHSLGNSGGVTLYLGNPPWVTNSVLSKLRSENLPRKENRDDLTGIEAITGSSNFDISEWMILELLKLRKTRRVIVAMLCKTSVARKLLKRIWQESSDPIDAKLFRINSKEVFDVSVDACLVYLDATTEESPASQTCELYSSPDLATYEGTFGFRDNTLVAETNKYDRWKHLSSPTPSGEYRWRSGIKHDCSKVMELSRYGAAFNNGYGESIEIEHDYVFPMLKSSEVAKWPSISVGNRWMLVTQKEVGQETKSIEIFSPKTWRYLSSNARYLDARKSSIYKGKPRYSVFGVGDYTFTNWKIAISGLYKTLNFALVGPYEDKPVVLDDTCYILACNSEEEAQILHALMNSQPAREFYESHIFWDAKRPITSKLLNRLDIKMLARECGVEKELEHARNANSKEQQDSAMQLRLFEKRATYTT